MRSSDPLPRADLAKHFFGDGLVDVYLGVIALFAAALITTDLVWMMVWGAPALGTPPPWLVGLGFALLLSATLVMLGGTLRLTRFYLYALLPPAGVGAAALGLTLPWAIALPAAVVLTVGLGPPYSCITL